MQFDGKVVLVTGASRGIGAAVAGAFVEAGARVVGTATTRSGAASIQDRVGPRGGCGEVVDVSSGQSVDELFKRLDSAGLTPGIVVNNAGITRDSLLARMKEEDWESVIQTDLGSLFRVCKAATRAMMKAREGRVVNIGSVVGAIGNAGQTNYAAAKAGLVGFTRALARELGGRNITVNAVAPGFIDTDMTRTLSETQRDSLLAQVPLRRFGDPGEVAAAVLFLCSPEAAYITGETLHVNGGMHMA
jgi:3-oxoacyl-[acyl-carrier protein] reductase